MGRSQNGKGFLPCQSQVLALGIMEVVQRLPVNVLPLKCVCSPRSSTWCHGNWGAALISDNVKYDVTNVFINHTPVPLSLSSTHPQTSELLIFV